MYRSKWCKAVRGYILIYVMFFGVLCITMMLIGFKLEVDRRRNTINTTRSTLEQGLELKYKEYLFSMFRKELITNSIQFNVEAIKNYLDLNDAVFKIIYETSVLSYDKSKNLLKITYPIDRYYNKIDYYKFEIAGNRLKFTLMHTETKNR